MPFSFWPSHFCFSTLLNWNVQYLNSSCAQNISYYYSKWFFFCSVLVIINTSMVQTKKNYQISKTSDRLFKSIAQKNIFGFSVCVAPGLLGKFQNLYGNFSFSKNGGDREFLRIHLNHHSQIISYTAPRPFCNVLRYFQFFVFFFWSMLIYTPISVNHKPKIQKKKKPQVCTWICVAHKHETPHCMYK